MEQNDLRQVDLVPIFGSHGRVSEVVNGKRDQQGSGEGAGRVLQNVAAVVI
jgi:hypothetical protein